MKSAILCRLQTIGIRNLSVKHILVHVDNGPRCAVRLELAATLARRYGGRVSGVFARRDTHAPSIVAHQQSDSLAQAAAEAEAAFTAQMNAAGVPASWYRMPYGEEAFLIRELEILSRFADLTVFGQHEPDAQSHALPADAVAEVIQQAGRPVMVVPYAGHFETLGTNVLVAWNGSREAARAVFDAMPILEKAASVHVVGLHGQSSASAADLPKVNIIDYLATHGIQARYEVFEPHDIGIMDMLLSRAADQACDLMVMGASAHHGLPFFKKGAGTRHVLGHMTVPVIFSC